MNLKLQWLKNKMNSLNLQGMIISNPVNIKYLTNLDAEGTLIITPKENVYITDGRYIEHVHSVLTLFDEIIANIWECYLVLEDPAKIALRTIVKEFKWQFAIIKYDAIANPAWIEIATTGFLIINL